MPTREASQITPLGTPSNHGVTCKNPIRGGGNFCQEHVCVADECLNAVDTDTEYCNEHACQVCGIHVARDGCCARHECAHGSCAGIKSGKSEYCRRHKCGACGALTESGPYCGDHTCTADDCFQLIREGLDYCQEHSCVACGIKVVGSRFCEAHECAADGCGAPRGENDWCVKHTCHVCNCQAEREFYGRPACREHDGTCIDCMEKRAASDNPRCMPCHRSYELNATMAETKQAMQDTVARIDKINEDLSNTKERVQFGEAMTAAALNATRTANNKIQSAEAKMNGGHAAG